MKVLRVAIGIAISATAVFALLRTIDVTAVWNTVRKADAGWIAAAVAILALGYTVRSIRWWLMLRRARPDVPFTLVARVLLIGFAANNVLPLRAGDALRAFGFHKSLGISSSYLLGTLLFERLLDLLALMVLWFAAMEGTRYSLPHPELVRMAGGLIAMATLSLVAALLFAGRIGGVLKMILRRALGERPLTGRLEAIVEQALGPFQSAGPALTLRLAGLSLLGWALEGLLYSSVAASLHLRVAVFAPWLAFVMANFAAMIPSSPGYVGTFHVAAVAALVSAGALQDEAAAFAVLAHAVLWLCVTSAGVIAYLALRPSHPRSDSVEPDRNTTVGVNA